MTTAVAQNGPEQGTLWGHAARHWADIQEAMVEPVFDAVLERASVGRATRYLDLGCGSGMALAKAHGLGADVTGLDAASGLLDIAGERLPPSRLHHGDLGALPFEDAAFDVVTGFNAIQYAADPQRALQEAARVAREDATVVVVTWGRPDGMEAAQVVSAMKAVLPPAPEGAPGPFALSAPDRLLAFAVAGNLDPFEMQNIESPWVYPDEETALRGLLSSGVAAQAIRRSGRAAVEEAHARAIAPFRQTDGSFRIGATFTALFARPAAVRA